MKFFTWMAAVCVALAAPAALAQSQVKIVDATAAANCLKLDTMVCRTKRDVDRCVEWHKKRAASTGADSIVILDRDPNMQVLGFIGKRSEMRADYYDCKMPAALATAPLNDYAEKYSAYSVPGNTQLLGQAFLRQQNGGVVTCAGSEVMILPDGAFEDLSGLPDRVWRVMRSSGLEVPGAVKATARFTTCDAQGNFAFRNLPKGSWRILTQVTWNVPNRNGYMDPQGGMLSKVAESSESAEPVYLTDADR